MKINSMSTKDQNVKITILNLENMKEYLCDFGVCKGFLDITSAAQRIYAQNRKYIYFKTYNSGHPHAKERI